MKLDRINIVLLYNDDRPIKSYFFQLQGLNARLELLITHLIQERYPNKTLLNITKSEIHL